METSFRRVRKKREEEKKKRKIHVWLIPRKNVTGLAHLFETSFVDGTWNEGDRRWTISD